jgi:hypothetical protein
MAFDAHNRSDALPSDWLQRVRSAAIHAISLAQTSLMVARGRAANSYDDRLRLKQEKRGFVTECVLARQDDPKLQTIARKSPPRISRNWRPPRFETSRRSVGAA